MIEEFIVYFGDIREEFFLCVLKSLKEKQKKTKSKKMIT